MRVIWDSGRPTTVREVYENLRERKQVAYTTVMSVMGKLARKGILAQDKGSTAYVYSATVSDTEVAESLLGGIVENVLSGAVEPLIACLLGTRRKLTSEEIEKLKDVLKKKA